MVRPARESISITNDIQASVAAKLMASRPDMFADPWIARLLAFRGGTALYKLHLRPAARYAEDIDLVQVTGRIKEACQSVPASDGVFVRPMTNR